MAESMTPDRICTCQPFFSGHVTEHPDCPRGQAEIAARAAAPSEPDIHRAGTDTYCPVVGVHEHPFRGPHHFREWDPDTYEPPAPDRAGLREAIEVASSSLLVVVLWIALVTWVWRRWHG